MAKESKDASSVDKAAPRRIAVVGAGISGLATAYILSRRSDVEVTLFEAEEQCGGHALTVDLPGFGNVDLGFQVCNYSNYPHLMGFFRELGIDTEPSDMSFSLSTPEVEWGSRSLSAVFAHAGSTISPTFYRMLYEVLAFGRQAPEVLEHADKWAGVTLGEYLKKRRYSSFFAAHYVVPMCAAIWSCSDAQALDFPVVRLVAFWKNHHLLDMLQRPVWRVVKGRSKAYVDAAVAVLPDVRTSTRVTSLTRNADGTVTLTTARAKPADGKNDKKKAAAGGTQGLKERAVESHKFDAVVMATHSDTTLAIMGDSASAAEAAALGAVKYELNDIYVHTDTALMPKSKEAWAAWNCIKQADTPSTRSVCVSYWANLLQNLPPSSPDVFVTLNPPTPPAADSTLHAVKLAHPLFNLAAVEAQAQLGSGALQGNGGVWYAGAWCGYGFHEDGIKSAVSVVEQMFKSKDVTPWVPRARSALIGLTPRFFLSLFERFGGAILAANSSARVILPNGDERIIGDRAAKAADSITLNVYNADLFQKVVLRSDIGLGEAYMDGDFEVDDLFHVFEVLSRASNSAAAKQATMSALGWLGGLLHRSFERLEHSAHVRNSNTEAGSARNIAYHYDAGNDFYRLVLDRSMLYSAGKHAALCGVDSPPSYEEKLRLLESLSFDEQEDELERAQMAKIDAMIERAQLRPGDHVLEIGCGWGECAIRMASKAKVRVTGITISREQLAEARKRVAAKGLQDMVHIEFCDYRKVEGTFDKVVSIEMIEAVGHEHLSGYFAMISRVLKPGGLAAIQVITLPDDRYEAYCNEHSDFIRTYIFPGGHLPSLSAMAMASSRVNLEIDGLADLGTDYAISLRIWRHRMMARQQQIRELGYPQRFIRMYEFYFAYCEAGFANRLLHDYQITWRKSAMPQTQLPVALPLESPARDPLTILLLGIWGCLMCALVVNKPHMACVPATIGLARLVHAGLIKANYSAAAASATASLFASAASASFALLLLLLTASTAVSTSTSTTTATVTTDIATTGIATTATTTAAAAVNAIVATISALPASLKQPISPPNLTNFARAVVGTAAGLASLRVWKLSNEKRGQTATRVQFEALTYAISLILAASALYYDVWLIAIGVSQISEAHSLTLRVRSMLIDAKRLPGPALWVSSWTSFFLLRLVPHALMLYLFVTAADDPATTEWGTNGGGSNASSGGNGSGNIPSDGGSGESEGNAVPSLPHIASTRRIAIAAALNAVIHDLAIGYKMVHAHIADTRAAAIATTSHRVDQGDTSGADADIDATSNANDTASKDGGNNDGGDGGDGGDGKATVGTIAPLKLHLLPILASITAAALSVYVTSFQTPQTAFLINCTSLCYVAGYSFLKLTGLLQPRIGTLRMIDRAEWRCRLLSNINAAALTGGAVLCFMEWPYDPPQEGWISAGISSWPVTFASLLAGYLQWDLCWMLWHANHTFDAAAVVHHILFIAISHYVLYGWYFKVPFAWLSAAELSTLPLNARWFLAVANKKASRAYLAASAAFAAFFILTRVIGYGLGIAHLWANHALWREAEYGLYFVVGGVHAGFALNLMWAKKVVANVAKAIGGKSHAD